MSKRLNQTIAGILSLLFVGQIMIFGDGASQGILHADTIASAAEAVEEAQNADQLAEEFESVTDDLGEVKFFDVPQSNHADVQLFSEALEENTYTADSETGTDTDLNYALATLDEIGGGALETSSLTISGKVQKGTVNGHTASDNTPIYVRIFDGDWNEIAFQEVSDGGEYSVTADTTGVHHVKFECDGYLPFYLKDFGTGSFQVGSGDSPDTVTLVPGDTTWNEENENQWSDDVINGADKTYVQSCLGATRGDSDFNPTMDVDGDNIISQADLDSFCDFYTELENHEEEITLSDLTMSLDINMDGVINDTDYRILAEIVETGNNPNGYSLPELSGSDGYFTDADLRVFQSYLDDARTYRSEVYFYNHEMTGDIYVNADDYSDGINKINAVAQKRGRSDNYYEYMDKDNNGTIEDSDVAWFSAAYSQSGDLDWDHAFQRNLKVLASGAFPYSFNVHDTNLDLNEQTIYVADCMSFTTDMPQFWDGQGATLDINGGTLLIENNLVFRTASPDGWDGNAGQLMDINGGAVVIGNCFDFGQANCYDTIEMTNDADILAVGGNWTYITLTDMEGKWTAGNIFFLGPIWEVNEASGDKSIFSSGTQVIHFGYEGGKQTILWDNCETYINNADGSLNTERMFNFGYVDEEGYCLGIHFLYDFTEENYWFRPWFRPYDIPDYTLYRKGWEIGDGVHIATGNYTKSFTDLSVTSPGVQSDFVRTYNSMSDEEGSFGIGWDFNIDVSKIVIPAEGYYQVVLPDGSNTTFKDDGNGEFECLNAHSTMTKSGDEYTIINAAQSQYHFNADGELDWVKDANGNQLMISAMTNNQRIVTDSTGRTYTITYNGNSEHSRITKIEDTAADRVVTYAYNDNFQLVSATSVSGGTEYYEYDGNGRLCKITNCYEEVTDQIVYNDNGSVNWLSNASGLKQVYTYDKTQQQTGLKEFDNNLLVKTYTYEYDEKYAVKTNTVETDGQTYEVDKITYSTDKDGENKYDEMIENVDIMGNTTKYDRDANGNVIKTTNADGTYTLARYNDKNMPLVQVDESGNVTINEYDEAGVNVVKQYQSLTPVSNADAIATTLDLSTLDYTDYAMTVYTYYPASETASIAGLVRTITDPEGYVTEYTYGTSGNAKGLPVTKTLKDGNTIVNTVSYEYNAQLQVSKETTSYDLTKNLYSVKEYEYDKFNNVIVTKDYGTGSTPATTITEYDLMSRKTAEYAPNYSADKSHGTLTTYYPNGNVKTETDPEGNVTSYEYDAYGQVTKKTNPDGTRNLTEYDGLQREKATYFQGGANGVKQILTATSYEFAGYNFDIYTAVDSASSHSCKGLKTIKTTYITEDKQVVSETLTDIKENTVYEKINGETKRTSAYYANGQLARQTDALGNTTKYEYGYLNKLTKTYTPFNTKSDGSINYSVTENQYDKNGNVTQTKQTVQEQDSSTAKYSVTQNQYNALGLLTQVTLSDGTSGGEKNITQYFYNNAGIQTKMYTGLSSANDSDYMATNYTYDAWGRLVKTTDSTGYDSGTITYDLNGNVLTSTDANGNVTTNTYDALNRVLTANTVCEDDAKNVSKSYVYDNMGRLTKKVSDGVSTSYEYDLMGRVTKEWGPNFKGYFYEGVSNYVKEQLVGEAHLLIYSTTSYEYDGEMRVVKVKESGNETVTYTYDANGNKASETLANGVVSTYTYNGSNKVTSLVTKSGNSTISEYEYSYYLDGSDACKTRTENGIIETTEYEYDGLKRLTEEAVTTGNSTDTYAYEYDDYGNRSKMTATGSEEYVTEYSYSDSDGDYTALLQKEVKTSTDVSNAAASYGLSTNPFDLTNAAASSDSGVETTTYTYDANGNQITKATDEKTETNTYDSLNQLIGFTDGETTASYTYDVDGLRLSKTVNGQTTEHVWDGNKQIIADVKTGQYYDADCYLRGTNLVATYSFENGERTEYTYYTQNAHGDVVNLTDANGGVIKSYTYDAFGVEINPSSDDVNVFRFCGEYFDTETGTIYLRARYYQASIGRFISRDSFTGENTDPLSLNLYTYCRNNPIFYFDPFGHSYSENNYVRDIIESGAEEAINRDQTIITGRTEDSVDQKRTYAYQECDDTLWGGIQCILKGLERSTSFTTSGGFGIGGSVDLGLVDITLMAVPLRNEKVYSTNSEENCTAWYSANVSILEETIGIGAEAKKTAPVGPDIYGNFNEYNPYASPFAEWEYDYYVLNKYSSIDQNMNATIDFSVGAYLFVGGDFTLSFDLNNFFKEIGAF